MQGLDMHSDWDTLVRKEERDEAMDGIPSPGDVGELNVLLRQHETWLRTEGVEGKRLDLSGRSLRGGNFRAANLRFAVFARADLEGSDFRVADVEGADFTAANLSKSDFTGAKFFLWRSLRRANLAHCKVDAVGGKLEELSIKERSEACRTASLLVLSACLYCWLTIAGTSDLNLVSTIATTKLPILDVTVSIGAFFFLAPALLLAVYLYLQVQLQSLWEYAGSMPAVLPSGARLHDTGPSWLLVEAMIANEWRDSQLQRVRRVLPKVLAWGLVPATVAAFWLRYLPRHDAVGSFYHAIMTSFAIFVSIFAYRDAMNELRATASTRIQPWSQEESALRPSQHRRWRRLIAPLVLSSLVVITYGLTWFGAIQGTRKISWVYQAKIDPSDGIAVKMSDDSPDLKLDIAAIAPLLLELAGARPFVDFSGEELSTKVNGASDQVKGIQLSGANLRYGNLSRAFMAKADLSGVDATGASFSGANLTGANASFAVKHFRCVGACIWETMPSELRIIIGFSTSQVAHTASFADALFIDANLEEMTGANVNFHRADLTRASLQRARLSDPIFEDVSLMGADLRQARIRRAVFSGAFLLGTRLEGVDLSDARGLTPAQLNLACGDETTQPPPGLTRPPACATPLDEAFLAALIASTDCFDLSRGRMPDRKRDKSKECQGQRDLLAVALQKMRTGKDASN